MKQFKFSLNTVLDYKERVEENEKNILASMRAVMKELMAQLAALQEAYKLHTEEYVDSTSKGLFPHEVATRLTYLKTIEKKIEQKLQEISRQEARIAKQLEVVVEATKEKKTIGKLKEKHYEKYVQESLKEQEKLIDEFVTNTRSNPGAGAIPHGGQS